MQAESSRSSEPGLEAMCRAWKVSRAGYYRWIVGTKAPREQEADLRDVIQQIAIDMSSYGYRRVTAELRRRGLVVNHKRVARLMREDNLLCVPKRAFVHTTDSRHPFAVYPNLVPETAVNGVNQLWVADITYIRLREEFVYLAVILDAHSRMCVGWSLKRTLAAELTLEALEMALARRPIAPGIIHHSDRGVQYACDGYVALLRAHGFRISMSAVGNPYDNAMAESFMKTLKYEEVYRFDYLDFVEALDRIPFFIESIYNEKRLHSALGYRPPADFERDERDQT